MSRITRFFIDKFKSLSEFDLPLPPEGNNFICLVGKNGSGKSTVLQAIDFVGQIFRGDISGWLKSRGWEKNQIVERPQLRSIQVEIHGEFGGDRVEWSATFYTLSLKCTSEQVFVNGERVLSLSDRKIYLGKEKVFENIYSYEGSILSLLEDKILKTEGLLSFVSFMRKIYSFDTLNSKQLRNRSREVGDDGNIGRGGEFLSGRLASFSTRQRSRINDIIKSFYPWIIGFEAKAKRGGWVEINFFEHGEGIRSISSQHTCDGVLRLLGFITELMTQDTFIVFDEIENGFNPEIMEKLIRILTECDKQIIITTHNPVLLNYMSDKTAIESVVLMFRKAHGKTGAVHFFELPELKERLQYLGPGEAFLDVNIDDVLEANQKILCPQRLSQ